MTLIFSILVGILIFTSSCAFTEVIPILYNDRATPGFRIYDPQPLLVSTCETTSIAFVPNYKRGYAVQPNAWLAKNKSTLKATAGIFSEASNDLDSTSLLTLFQALGSEAIKAVDKLSALGEGATGGLKKAGVWRMDYDNLGKLTGLTPIGTPLDCV